MKERMPTARTNSPEKEHTTPVSETPRTPEVFHRLKEQVEQDYDRLQRGFSANHKDLTPEAVDQLYTKLSKGPQFSIHTENVTIPGASVTIMGVEHLPETILLRHKELVQAIQEADVVMLEASPQAGNATTNEDFTSLQSELAAHGFHYSSEQIRTHFNKIGGVRFFRHIEMLSALFNKPILSADPHSGGDRLRTQLIQATTSGNGVDNLERLDELIMYAQTGVIPATLLGSAVIFGKKALEPAETASDTTHSDHPGEGVTSRRNFLKIGAALGAIGFGLMPAVSNNRDAHELKKTPKPASETPYYSNVRTSALYNLGDYRNTVVAEGIKDYVKTHPNKKILIIYGDFHRIALAQYLKNPTLLAAKHKLYAPYRLEAHEQVQEYQFQPLAENDAEGNVGTWKETYKREL